MNIIKRVLVVSIFLMNCLVQSAPMHMSLEEQNEIRQLLYNNEIDLNSLDNETLDMYKHIIQDHITTLKEIGAQEDGANWNIVEGTLLAGSSAACAYSYYCDIIFPYVIELSAQRGLSYAIKFNKDFIKNYPLLAAWYATPLFASLILGKLSYDYLRKGWKDNKSLNTALLRDEAVLLQLEKAIMGHLL